MDAPNGSDGLLGVVEGKKPFDRVDGEDRNELKREPMSDVLVWGGGGLDDVGGGYGLVCVLCMALDPMRRSDMMQSEWIS